MINYFFIVILMLYTINTIQGKKYTIEENTNLDNLKHKILKEIGKVWKNYLKD